MKRRPAAISCFSKFFLFSLILGFATSAAPAQQVPPYRNSELLVEQRVEDLLSRMTLNPGETQTVEFILGPDELSFLDRDRRRAVEPGFFRIMVGGNSVDLNESTLNVIAE